VLLEPLGSGKSTPAFVGGAHTVYAAATVRTVDNSANVVAASVAHFGLAPGRWVCAVQLVGAMPVELGFVDSSAKFSTTPLGLAQSGHGIGFMRPAGKRALHARNFRQRRRLARSPHSRAHQDDEEEDDTAGDGPGGSLKVAKAGFGFKGRAKQSQVVKKSMGAMKSKFAKGPATPAEPADEPSPSAKKPSKPESADQIWVGSAWRPDDVIALAIEVF
jgi:hypothetical protein